MESSASSEAPMRLKAYPKMQEALDTLPPKLLLLSSDEPTKKVDLEEESLEGRVERVVSRIERAHFIGGHDLPKVLKSYRDYVSRIAASLTETFSMLPSSVVSESEPSTPLLALPTVDAPPTPQLRLAPGQLVLVLSEGDGSRSAGGQGGTRFGVVDESGRASLKLAGGSVDIAYDACVQAMLPWRAGETEAEGVEEGLVRQVAALPALLEPARRLNATARALAAAPASVKKEQLERVREEAERAVQALEQHPLTRQEAQAAMQAIRSSVAAALEPTASSSGSLFSTPAFKDKSSREGVLRAVQAAVAQLPSDPELVAAAALRRSGALGTWRYAAGQWLSVRHDGAWCDAEVVRSGTKHELRVLPTTTTTSGVDEMLLQLHPWNHAPRELPLAAFEALREWWAQSMRAQHTSIADVLTGRRLDALQQCVAIEVSGDAGHLDRVRDVRGLSEWLHALHSARSAGEAVGAPGAALLTAPPASGKTTLISQAVVLALDRAELVPIVIKVQLLQARLRDRPDAFASSWNWIDAYLRLVHTDKP
jgi:hypothetical protein